ncbi:MAG: hypothetical protein QOG43_3566, partial [Actinomycetota bacterium]|nr:hypothetical protein [Actinomycetota bacterium]
GPTSRATTTVFGTVGPVSRRDAIILRSAAVWTVFIWVTRIRNILGDETRATSFKVVHVVLALVSVAFAAAIWRVAARSRPVKGRRNARDRVDTSS